MQSRKGKVKRHKKTKDQVAAISQFISNPIAILAVGS